MSAWSFPALVALELEREDELKNRGEIVDRSIEIYVEQIRSWSECVAAYRKRGTIMLQRNYDNPEVKKEMYSHICIYSVDISRCFRQHPETRDRIQELWRELEEDELQNTEQITGKFVRWLRQVDLENKFCTTALKQEALFEPDKMIDFRLGWDMAVDEFLDCGDEQVIMFMERCGLLETILECRVKYEYWDAFKTEKLNLPFPLFEVMENVWVYNTMGRTRIYHNTEKNDKMQCFFSWVTAYLLFKTLVCCLQTGKKQIIMDFPFKTMEEASKIFDERGCKGNVICVPIDCYRNMWESLDKLPEKKKKNWKHSLNDKNGQRSKVRYADGWFWNLSDGSWNPIVPGCLGTIEGQTANGKEPTHTTFKSFRESKGAKSASPMSLSVNLVSIFLRNGFKEFFGPVQEEQLGVDALELFKKFNETGNHTARAGRSRPGGRFTTVRANVSERKMNQSNGTEGWTC